MSIRIVAALAALVAAAPALPDPPSTAVPPIDSPPRAYGKSEGLIPGIVFGPKLSLLNLPTLGGVGFEAKALNLFGASFDYGLVPDIKLSNVAAGMTNWTVGAKVYPFRGSFFLGAAYGNRSFHATVNDTTNNLNGRVDVSSNYIAPEVGWRWVWDSGFYMGMDLGWQFVTSNTVAKSANFSQLDPSKQKNINDATDKIGTAGLPVLALMQVGFFL